jgi:K+-sensing histidine kinase KdpD
MVPKEQVERLAQALERIDHPGDAALADARASVRRIGTDRIEDALADVIDSLPELASKLGKASPVTTIQDHGIVVRSQVAGLLRNAFVHLFRNAVDHGIETPDERQAAGKPQAGHIALDVALDERHLRLALRDDGRGLALDRIRAAAIASGLIGADDRLSPEQTAALVLRSGLSTAAQLTDVSGRGVGMDAVRGFVEAEGGSIELELTGDESATGSRSFRVVLTLPAKFGLRLAEPSATAVHHA